MVLEQAIFSLQSLCGFVIGVCGWVPVFKKIGPSTFDDVPFLSGVVSSGSADDYLALTYHLAVI